MRLDANQKRSLEFGKDIGMRMGSYLLSTMLVFVLIFALATQNWTLSILAFILILLQIMLRSKKVSSKLERKFGKKFSVYAFYTILVVFLIRYIWMQNWIFVGIIGLVLIMKPLSGTKMYKEGMKVIFK